MSSNKKLMMLWYVLLAFNIIMLVINSLRKDCLGVVISASAVSLSLLFTTFIDD